MFKISNVKKGSSLYKVIEFLGIRASFCVSRKLGGREGLYNKNIIPKSGFLYKGNPEWGFCSMSDRIEDTDGQLEYGDMVITNQVIAKRWIDEKTKTVVNIGSGVGTFEFYNAPLFPDARFVASEFDKTELEWAKANRAMNNVVYGSETMPQLLKQYGKFDLAVSVDVLEHVADYKGFLDDFVKLSDRAVISTPNRDRYDEKEKLIAPPYKQHVQEWNAGELYFILKMYYKNVKLYSLVDDYNSEELTEVGIYSYYNKLIAYCEN